MNLLKQTICIDYVPGTYVREFDGWRGIGVLFVVLAHYIPSLFIGSWVFMEMFFVMSGFLITGILIDSKSKKNYYGRFIYRRTVRVFPLYYLSLIIIFYLLPKSLINLDYYRNHQGWFWLYIQNWLFSIEGWPDVKALHHFWSLAIEEQFYIIWPLFVWLLSTKKLLRFCVFLFFASIIFRNIGLYVGFVMPFPYVATLGRMEPIVLGAIIAITLRLDKKILEKYTYPISIISGLLMIILFTFSWDMKFENLLHYKVTYTVVDIFFAGMITLTLCSNRLLYFKKLINNPFFITMGIMSYCIYIFHYPLMIIIDENCYDYIYSFFHDINVSKIICRLIAITISIPIIWVIHKKIEVPLWKLKKNR